MRQDIDPLVQLSTSTLDDIWYVCCAMNQPYARVLSTAILNQIHGTEEYRHLMIDQMLPKEWVVVSYW